MSLRAYTLEVKCMQIRIEDSELTISLDSIKLPVKTL